MGEFLGHYLAAGLRDIVSIDYDSHEEQSGFQEENISETIVARKGAEILDIYLPYSRYFLILASKHVAVAAPACFDDSG